MSHKIITYEDRKIVEEMLIQNKSYREIGEMLRRDHTVISREVRKNCAGATLPELPLNRCVLITRCRTPITLFVLQEEWMRLPLQSFSTWSYQQVSVSQEYI